MDQAAVPSSHKLFSSEHKYKRYYMTQDIMSSISRWAAMTTAAACASNFEWWRHDGRRRLFRCRFQGVRHVWGPFCHRGTKKKKTKQKTPSQPETHSYRANIVFLLQYETIPSHNSETRHSKKKEKKKGKGTCVPSPLHWETVKNKSLQAASRNHGSRKKNIDELTVVWRDSMTNGFLCTSNNSQKHFFIFSEMDRV